MIIKEYDNFQSREALLKMQFESDKEIIQEQGKKEHVDKSIIVEKFNLNQYPCDQQLRTLNLKYSALVPLIEDVQYDVIVANQFILDEITSYVDYTIIETDQPQLPIAQYTFLIEDENMNQSERVKALVTFISSTMAEESDIVVYCKDIDEMEQLRLMLANIKRIRTQLLINQQTNELLSQVFPRQANYDHTIYLLLEAQEIYDDNNKINDQITLIIHTNQKVLIQTHSKYAVNYEYCKLSQTELLIRELSKSSKLGVKIAYAFTSQEYMELPIKPLQINLQPPKMIEILHDLKNQGQSHQLMQQFAIICSVLMTNGQLLAKHDSNSDGLKNKHLIVRTSPFWSKVGDAISWVNIITHLANKVNRIVSGEIEDVDALRIAQTELAKWCNDHSVNQTKAILTLVGIKELTNTTQYSNLQLINDMSTPPLLLKQQSSFTERIDERLLEQHLPHYFPSGQLQLGLPKQYQSNDKLYQIDDLNILQFLGYQITEICLLAIKDSKLLYQNKHSLRKNSIQYREILIPQIGQAIMNDIWKNNSKEILRFEEENNCHLEPNLELNSITIYCDEQEQQAEQIKTKFNELISQKKLNWVNDQQEIPFYDQTKFILSLGGMIKKWIHQGQNKAVKVLNLPVETVEKDIFELFEEYTEIKQVKLEYSKNSCTAIIMVEDYQDVQYLIEQFNNTQYEDRTLKVLTSDQATERKPTYHNQILQLFWYAKKSKGKTLIIFHQPEDATQLVGLLKDQKVDGNILKVEQIDNVSIQISNISQFTTDYDLIQFSGGKSKIKYMTTESVPNSEARADYSHKILSLVESALAQNNKYKKGKNKIELLSIQKKKEGKRVGSFSVPNIEMIQEVIGTVNGMLTIIGNQQVKIHCRAKYRQKYEVSNLIREIIEQELPNLQQQFREFKHSFSDQQVIKQDIITDQQYFEIESTSLLIFNQLKQSVNSILQGRPVDLQQDTTMLFSDFGSGCLRKLEVTLQVQFIVDKYKKTLHVCCGDQIFNKVREALIQLLSEAIRISIPFPMRSLKQMLGLDGQGLEQFKQQFDLSEVRYNVQAKELQLLGNVGNIDSAKMALQQILVAQSDDQQQGISKQMCSYCCDEMTHAYLLQGCNHKFCLECIQFSLMNSLNDVSTLPLKCPQCQCSLILEDIHIIIGQENHQKLTSAAINRFVQDNLNIYTFCYTPDCPNIQPITAGFFNCSVCDKAYCCSCKAANHPGMSCEENKIGATALLLKLMEKEDIRKCPKCSTLIQRVSGCYRVTCNACQQSICWKNGKNGKPCMLFFKTASECYAHLEKEHGGYF